MSLIVLKPYALALRNRWRESEGNATVRVRDAIILGFALFVMGGIFVLTQRGLIKVSEYTAFAYLTPSIPLGMILLFLMAMLFISSLLSSIGVFFTARDLELQLSAPLHRGKLFFGKFLLVLCSSTWMPFIFLFPLLLGYGSFLGVAWQFYPAAMLVMIFYFMIPASLAVLVSIIGTALFPIGRTRELLIISGIMFIAFVALFVEIVGQGAQNKENVDQLLRVMSVLSLPNELWLPSHWASFALRDGLEGGSVIVGPYSSMLFFVALALLCLSYLSFLLLHQRGYARAQNHKHKVHARTARLRELLLRYLPQRYRPDFAIFSRELGTFSREITQALQLLLLSGIYIVYLYNVGAMRALDSLPEKEILMWRAFIFIANTAMGAFVATAACTRFIFPSISLEGASFWIISTSPMNLRRFVWLKFWIWFVPLAFISFLTFSAGAIAVGVSWWAVLLNGCAGVIISVGLAGLATGTGAYFVNLKWEHPSQLAASFGSLTFMLLATVLIGLSIFPIGSILYSGYPDAFLMTIHPILRWAALVALAGGLVVMHILVARVALSIGVKRLAKVVAI